MITQKQPSSKNIGAAYRILGEKSSENKGGSQEMAEIMLLLINFNSNYY